MERSNMDESLLKEIQYLTRLIEHHKQKSLDKSCHTKESFPNRSAGITKSVKCANSLQKSETLSKTCSGSSYNETTTTNVYINPNFKPQHSSIHINPRLQEKSLVHINPKMMKSVINSNENTGNHSIQVTTNIKDNFLPKQNSIKKSVYVNPKLIKKLSSSMQPKPVEQKETVTPTISHPVCSRLKFIKNVNSVRTVNCPRKSNSNIVLLSKRKLIRVKRSSRKSLNASQTEISKMKKSLNLVKTVKPSSNKLLKTKTINTSQQSISKYTTSMKSPIIKPKINKYRIDRTIPKTIIVKDHLNQTQAKVINKKMELITIAGIVYKSSKNQLVRKSYGAKKKHTTNIKSDKFIVATNGKKLCRIKPLKEALGNSRMKIVNKVTGSKLSPNLSQKSNYKTNISNKVKQRSIQILRNKMQKNNQPCLIFQRFGYCSNHEKGTCLKRHDKKQISLCRKFLQGNCLLDKCPLSHDIGPEKMPTCKYFLEGCCTRDGCPYRHIKVSSNTPICREFLQGYCAKGQECKQRHENLCPEFEKMEKCSKGKHCPYPHKSQTSLTKQNHLKRKYNVRNDQITHPKLNDMSPSNNENRLRYYEQTDTVADKSFNKRRDGLIKKLNLMKAVAQTDSIIEILDDTVNFEFTLENSISEDVSDAKVIKRPPIGNLPAYIPID
ncbi:zinc finger CCCH domain-containing protein 3 isoform X2 [Lasioglossum baleicum]|uniref:zinc finger CCCH domain-containing protein 3 isoform X2 n=1 Tax=Lasioglossum baleicum TaxID=434251 RepID=UPI003FCD019F